MTASPLKYSFGPHENTADGFVRILKEIERRLRHIAEDESTSLGTTVHNARVLGKRLRALVWFARPVLTPSLYKQARAKLRKASGLLSEQRDIAVARETLQKLAKKSRKPDRRAIEIVAARVAHSLSKSNGAGQHELRRALRAAAESICQTIDEVTRGAAEVKEAWPAPRKRANKALKKMEKAARKAQNSTDDVDFHQWRKEAKRLLYELELTHPSPRGKTAKTLHDVDKLQTNLGSYHDIVVLQKRLRHDSPREKRPLELLSEKKSRLRRKAEKLCRKI